MSCEGCEETRRAMIRAAIGQRNSKSIAHRTRRSYGPTGVPKTASVADDECDECKLLHAALLVGLHEPDDYTCGTCQRRMVPDPSCGCQQLERRDWREKLDRLREIALRMAVDPSLSQSNQE